MEATERKSKISRDIFERAAVLMSSQRRTPLSPVGVDSEGDVVLCAAACVARAGLELRVSRVASASFVDHLAGTQDFELVRRVFTRFGWDEQLCDSMLANNNESPESTRKESVLNHFKRLSVNSD